MDNQKTNSSEVFLSYEHLGNKVEIPADKIVINIKGQEYLLSDLFIVLHKKIFKWNLPSRKQ